MKITCINIIELSIPFRSRVKHSLASRSKSSSVIFEIITENGIHGYGEGSPREYVTGESIETTTKALRLVADGLKNTDIDVSENAVAAIKYMQHAFNKLLSESPSAKCAMELALFDLYGKIQSKNVGSLFGPLKSSTVQYSGIIADDKIDEIRRIVKMVKEFRIKQVKIKDGKDFDSDTKKFNIIRSSLGEDIEFRIDANGAWTFDEAIERIDFYNKNGVYIFEQPMATDLNRQYPFLLESINSKNHIILDESICTYDDAIWFVENKGAHGINLKISKHGGLVDTLRIHQFSSENGFVNQIGCHVGETSILTSAGAVLAALTHDLLAYEGAYGNLLLEYDIVRHPVQFKEFGKLSLESLTDKAGFGLKIDPILLNSASIINYQNCV